METKDEKTYYEEISTFIKKITGYNIPLSAKDRSVLQKFFQKQIPVETLKKLIKQEIVKLPPEKRKKFRISSLEAMLLRIKKTSAVQTQTHYPEEYTETLQKIKKINKIWKHLPEKEKAKIQKEAIERVKKRFILTNIDPKKVLKSVIREIIEEKYLE
ncbi:hypothetical protein [Persephonella sp.]